MSQVVRVGGVAGGEELVDKQVTGGGEGRVVALLLDGGDDSHLLELTREVQAFESANRSLEMRSANLVLEVRAREDDLKTAKDRCQDLENHLEEILNQNQVFRLQIQELSAKVDLLTTNLKENRVTRDSVVHDLDSVNELAVRLNTEKIELLSKMEAQNSQVQDKKGVFIPKSLF